MYNVKGDGGNYSQFKSFNLEFQFIVFCYMLEYHLTFCVLKENQVEVFNRRKKEMK